MEGPDHLQMVQINPGGQGPGNQLNGNQINGNQINLNQINGNQINGNQINGNQINGNQVNGNQINGNQINGNQINGNQINGNQINGNQINGNQINGNQINGNQNGLWCIDWNKINRDQLMTDLKSKWTLNRSWKTMLLFFILLLASVLDITSDACIAYKFMNGQTYVKRIQNQSDISVNSNECRLIKIIANLTSEERIGESFRYVFFFKITIFIYN